MDRTQYGRRAATDAYRPFDLVCRTKPLPGYALLADLQTSIPSSAHSTSQSPVPLRQSPSPTQHHHQQHQQQQQQYSYQGGSSSHRTAAPHQYNTQQQQQQQYQFPAEPRYSNGEVVVDNSAAYPPKKVYYQESKEETRTETRSSGPVTASIGGPQQQLQQGGSELDSLLSELNHTRYSSSSVKDRNSSTTNGGGMGAPPGGAARPSVDSLLNELNSVSSSDQSTRLSQQHVSHSAQQPITASTATRDLDHLMAELSDFKGDRSWVAALDDHIEPLDHPERVGSSSKAGGRSSSTTVSSFTKRSVGGGGEGVAGGSYSPSLSNSNMSSSSAGYQSTGATKTSSSSSSNLLADGTMPGSPKMIPKPPSTPPPRPPTPRNVVTPPPRPPAPVEGSVISVPLVLPCPGTPPPIPPPPAVQSAPLPVPGSPSGSLRRRAAGPAVIPEPYERPDSGGPVRRNDSAYRWITDEVKYEIREQPLEDPPIIPDYQNDKLRSPALVRKLLNRNDTYAKPEKPKSPSPAPPPPPAPAKEPSPPVADELDCMLGSLANHMTEQGVTTTQKGCCCACDKPIVGQVITALGKTWHPEHFTCGHCNSELGSKNFFERDGRPYCEACYHELFSPRCAYCDGSILDKCVTALDKNWHPDHFFCAQCGNTFGEEGFHEKDGKAYCREDYYNMFAPKCGGCNSPIMENYISALNAQWHPECFVCRDCKQPVTGKSYYAMEGKPVCAGCLGVSEDEDEGEEED